MPNNSVRNSQIIDSIAAYGANPEHIMLFDVVTGPSSQDYLDLITARARQDEVPDGVAEAQGRPILYFVDHSRLTGSTIPSSNKLDGIISRLACRGERAYLAVLEPGKLRISPVTFDVSKAKWEEYVPGTLDGKTLFSRLVNGVVEWDGDLSRGDEVFERLRGLLRHSADQLSRTRDLKPDVLSLLGRALFFRFLRDRKIVNEKDIEKVCPSANDWRECFCNSKNAAATCKWLDKTFNGNFLPLTDKGSEDFFNRISKLTSQTVFSHLTAVVLGSEPSGSGWQHLFDWGTFDFAHVPVGLLSQVYEDFCWQWERESATVNSVHYTPRNIAVTLIDEAFADRNDPSTSCVLDPACGAGVFLVLALRRLYKETWSKKASDH